MVDWEEALHSEKADLYPEQIATSPILEVNQSN
jgi:hypothetical protein